MGWERVEGIPGRVRAEPMSLAIVLVGFLPVKQATHD